MADGESASGSALPAPLEAPRTGPSSAPEALPATWTYLRRVWALLALEAPWGWIVGAAFAEGVLALASPWVAARAMDEALPNSARRLLGLLAVLVVVGAVYTESAAWLHARVRVVLQQRVEIRCLRHVLERLLQAPYASLRQIESGGASETLAAASSVSTALVRAIADSILHVASGVAIFAMLMFYSPGLSALSLGVAAVMCAGAVFFAARQARFARRVVDASSRRQALFHVLLRAVPMLRVTGATPRLAERWANSVRQQATETVHAENARVQGSAWLQSGGHVVTLAATVWLTITTLGAETSLGVMMTCTMLVGNFQRVALGMTGTFTSLLALRPLMANVDRLVTGAPPPERRLVSMDMHEACAGSLRLDDVWFRYDSQSRWVLQGYSREFSAGQYTVLRAPSGAGKTTMLRLLAGLVRPERGQVSVLGHDPFATRGLVAYLPQQSMLLEASIAANLTTLSGEPLERALRFAHLTGLSDMLGRLPMGVETIVSAGGGNLSSGQRQLILLTALFSSRSPVLLLDEAVSQLDPVSLARIDWSMLTRGRTVLSVQHG